MRNRKRTLPVKVKQENVYEEAEQHQQPLKKRLEIDSEAAKGKGEDGISSGDDDEEYQTTISKIIKTKTFDASLESSFTMERAQEVQADLDPKFPSFVKLITRSHVTQSFKLGFPRDFYKKNLPQDDVTVILIGKNNKEYKVNFWASGIRLVGGWRRFSRVHKLQEGDVVIFQLVRPLKFKVHIVRQNAPDTNKNQSNVKKVDVRNSKESGTWEKAEGNLQPKIAHNFFLKESDTSLRGASGHSESCRKESHAHGMDCINSTGSFVDILNFSHQFDNHMKDSHTMERAQEVQANLDPKFPSFIKLIARSHVTKRFELGVPIDFYKKNLPQDDETIILIGNNNKEYKVKLLASNIRFSAGWREFARVHKLQEGDVVIFQLVRPLKFKVHIVRQNAPDEEDNALELLNLSTNSNQSNVEAEKVDVSNSKESGTCKKAEGHSQPKIAHDYSLTESETSLGGANDHSESCSKESPAEGMDGINSTGSFVDIHRKDSHTVSMECFQNTESFVDLQSFSINVNGFALDSELSESVRTKYYELCCSRQSYLHNHLLKSVKPDLAAAMICETVNIANEIRASGIFTSVDDYAVWDKTLQGFEIFGMDVDFLRARLNKLLRLALQSGEKTEMKRYHEATLKLAHVEEEINCLKQEKNVLECEISTLKVNVQREELIHDEAARAPW